jgi:putative ABC transport system permease protein
VDLYDLFVISLRTLAKHKLRSGLTVLGVVIGIAAVTTMVSVGQGAGQMMQTEFQSLGTNVLIVFPANSRTAGVQQGRVATLTAADADAIAAECPSVGAVSPFVGAGGNNQVVGGDVNWQPDQMFGVGPDYPLVRNWTMASGDFFTASDVAGANKVCVIGHTVAAQLFPNADPVGRQVRVNSVPLQVVGVLAAKGADLTGDDQDNIVLIPWTTVRKRLQASKFADIGLIFVSARSEELSPRAEQEIRSLLMERHHIPLGGKPDFEVRNTAEIAQVLGAITGTMTALLAAIAAISLLVGGVGIMNIMLVSVTERTREIGLRMALGARPRDILRQFLVEAVVLSSIGGLIGIGLGIAASAGLTAVLNLLMKSSKWPTVVSVPAALIALGFAAAVGIFFGYYPARRASRLDPIEALRYD